MHTVGIDEAGRGALAGPVVVAVVAVPIGFSSRVSNLPRLRDSKKLSPAQRNVWFDYIKNTPGIFYTSARVYPRPIDRKNIAVSANIAASRALDRMLERSKIRPRSIMLDGSLYLHSTHHRDLHAKTIIRGDERFISIKFASIVAKVTRDAYMTRLHKKFPAYEFPRHKGYGTELHRTLIMTHGPSNAHRLTYLKNWVE